MEGKRKNHGRSKTEPRRVARDRNKVQEPRDTRDKDNSKDVPKVIGRLAETRRQGEKHKEFGNLDGDYYLLASPVLPAPGRQPEQGRRVRAP